jgi:hypothetical protein
MIGSAQEITEKSSTRTNCSASIGSPASSTGAGCPGAWSKSHFTATPPRSHPASAAPPGPRSRRPRLSCPIASRTRTYFDGLRHAVTAGWLWSASAFWPDDRI